MIKFILIASLAIMSARQTCTAGCLKCTTDGSCIVPDILNSYYLNGTTATLVTLTNCSLSSVDGKCVACNSGFFLDSSTGKCVAVLTANVIANCAAYGSATSCSVCKAGYYLNTNTCAAVETTITNCSAYDTTSTCFYCANGYLLALDYKSCTVTPPITNCGDFSFVRCNSCDSGYVLNPNNYLALALVSTSAVEMANLASFAYNFSDARAELIGQQSCQVESTNNCALFDQPNNKCTQCSSGYYLDATSEACVVFPDQPIANCVTYTAVSTCKTCGSGYYLTSNACVQITGTSVIANCSTYNGSAATVVCLACASNYYLSSNTCTIRSNSINSIIANCATKDVLADKCAACSTGFVLSSDGLFCFTAIANCSEYVSTASGQTLRCNTCNNTYFLSNTDASGANTCTLGAVSNCRTYATGSSTSCLTCVNGFFLSSAACVAHVTISKCSTYSTSNLNACSVCNNPGFFNFFLNKYCQTLASTAVITNCTSYSGDISSPQCAACASGYYVNNNACSLINIVSCLSLDVNNNCAACSTGFALAENSMSCIAPLAFLTNNCLVNSTADNSNEEKVIDVDCSACVTGSVPFDLMGYYACISTDDAKQYVASSAAVDGCIKYDNNMACTQCDVNNSKPNLDTTSGTCTTTCANGVVKYLMGNINGDASNNSYNITHLNVCMADAILATASQTTGCISYAPDLGPDAINNGLICIKCNTSYLNVVATNETSYSNVDPAATNLNLFFPSAFVKYPELNCVNRSTVGLTIVSNNTVTSIANCAYYKLEAGNDYSCMRCEHGYTGTISTSAAISACEQDTNCTTDRYYNLDSVINNLLSCYKCSDTRIPFIAYNSSGNDSPVFTGFAKYSTTAVSSQFVDVAGTNKNIACRTNNQSTFGLTAGYGVSANCAIGALLVTSDGTFNEATPSYGTFCAACKPGFVGTKLADATAAANFPFVYTACTAIANCATTSSYFNACSDCNTGFILNYTNNNIDFTKCLTVPTITSARFANCLAASPDASTTAASVCMICKNGYFLNNDGVCENFQPLNCTSGQFTPIQTKSSTSTLNWSLWLNSNTIGCSKCSNGFIAYLMNAKEVTCMSSTWITSSVDAQTTTAYIPFCNNYGIDTGLTNNRYCRSCKTSYVLSGSLVNGNPVANGTTCYSNASIPNCTIASSSSICLQCINQTFSLKANKCELGNIANCAAYNFNNSSDSVKCTTCAPDYYLNTTTNACVQGSIYNCKVLTNNSPSSCVTCADGFVRIASIADNVDYCYPKESSLGCNGMTIANNSSYNGGSITCTSCNNTATQLVGSTPNGSALTICAAYNTIPNCASYNVGNTLTTSNFSCTACSAGYYLSNNRCVARTNIPAMCSVYTVSVDTCAQCNSTSYLSSDSKTCVDFPKGIVGCRTYSNATTCTACGIGRFLTSNTCVTATTAITNCQYYSSNTSCSLCASGYALISIACVRATAANCLTYTSESVCSNCPSGYVLQTTSGITNCIALTKTGCSTIDINSPYDCLACTGAFYLSAGACLTPTAITNCAAYATATTCAMCAKGYALISAATSCVQTSPISSYIDTQCLDSQVVSTPVCSRCNPGYYFVNGTCTGVCSVSNCLACTPSAPSTCFICKSGSYQNKDGTCTLITNPSSSSHIIASFLSMIMIIALFVY